MPEIIVIAHNIRSTHNVGAIFRTSEGFGVTRIILSGYTPYPRIEHDTRLPHIADKLTDQIHKTALGAEVIVPFDHQETPDLQAIKADGYTIVGLEQDGKSIMLPDYQPPQKIALLLGEEVHGLTPDQRQVCDDLIEIPMDGQKESFNVSVAAGIALYALKFPRAI
jgi:tRNA G18 (ribose-2'-O)-methylase SpoU